MKVTVVGKLLVCGASKKTGKFRDGTKIYYTYPTGAIEGEAVGEHWVFRSLFPYEEIQIGEQYDMVMRNGYIVGFAPAGAEEAAEDSEQ